MADTSNVIGRSETYWQTSANFTYFTSAHFCQGQKTAILGDVRHCRVLPSLPSLPSLFSSNNTTGKLMYFPIENLHYLQEEKASPFFPVNESCSGNGAIRALQGWCRIRGKGWGSCSIPVLGISKYQKW